MLVALHQADVPEELEDKQAAYFNQRHFAVLAVDARGSGASGGNRKVERSPSEVADIGEVAAWATRQPWSNGRVGTSGFPTTVTPPSLLQLRTNLLFGRSCPLYDNFDVLKAIQPGGVALSSELQEWSNVVAALDRNDVCGAQEDKGWNCWRDRLMMPGVRPVDADSHGK